MANFCIFSSSNFGEGNQYDLLYIYIYKFVVLAILYILGVNFTLKERQNSNNKSLIAAPSYIIIIGCTMLKIKLKQLMQVNFLSPMWLVAKILS